MNLTNANYYSLEANREFMSVSQLKSFLKCEAAAIVKVVRQLLSLRQNGQATRITKRMKHGTGGKTTMKFEKDGKVYESFEDAVDAFFLGDRKIFVNGEKAELKFPDDVRQSMIWAYEDADMGRVRLNAKLMGYEVIDDTPTIAETAAKRSEDAKPDPVNHPAHYTSGGIECIDAMQAAFGDEAVKDFCLCNAFKYLWRHRNKNGVEDLKKARWYLNRLIREMEVTDDDT